MCLFQILRYLLEGHHVLLQYIFQISLKYKNSTKRDPLNVENHISNFN